MQTALTFVNSQSRVRVNQVTLLHITQPDRVEIEGMEGDTKRFGRVQTTLTFISSQSRVRVDQVTFV